MGRWLNIKKNKIHTGLSLEDRYVMIFDKIIKYLDNLGYKCVYTVKITAPYSQFITRSTNQYNIHYAHYAVQYLFIKKDIDHNQPGPLSTDVYSPACTRLNRFLSNNRVFKRSITDVDMSVSENYVNAHLHKMFAKLKTPKKLFCSLFIPDILDYGIAIRDPHTHVITWTVIHPKSSVEEALLNLDILAA